MAQLFKRHTKPQRKKVHYYKESAMEQNVQEKEGISLLDILRLLWSKVLILILTVFTKRLMRLGKKHLT